MIGSFYLVMGNVCRFHARGMMSQIAMVVDRYGWNGGMDYWISDKDFWGLEREFGPFDVDYFASDQLW